MAHWYGRVAGRVPSRECHVPWVAPRPAAEEGETNGAHLLCVIILSERVGDGIDNARIRKPSLIGPRCTHQLRTTHTTIWTLQRFHCVSADASPIYSACNWVCNSVCIAAIHYIVILYSGNSKHGHDFFIFSKNKYCILIVLSKYSAYCMDFYIVSHDDYKPKTFLHLSCNFLSF